MDLGLTEMPVGDEQMQRLGLLRHLALDMDGTIYKDGTLFPYTLAFLQRLDSLGIGFTFLTNNSSRSVADYLDHLKSMGIVATTDQMYTSTGSALDYLRSEMPTARNLYVVGSASLKSELNLSGFTVSGDEERPDLVLVAFDPALAFADLCKAAWWIRNGVPYIATHPDRICPTDKATVLIDCGALCACLESATGIPPFAVLGKPDPRMLSGILSRHNLKPEELGMVGDRIYTDIAMAHRAGTVGILVLSGEATAEDARKCDEPPHVIIPGLEELGQLLAETQEKTAI